MVSAEPSYRGAAPGKARPAEGRAHLGRAPAVRLAFAWLAMTLVLVALAAPAIALERIHVLAPLFFLIQDAPVLAGICGLAALCLAWPKATAFSGAALERLGRWLVAWRAPPPLTLWAAIGGVFVVSLAGAVFSAAAYPLSVDEFLAGFDAEIFRHGWAMAPVPAPWRVFVPALQPMFLLPIDGNAWWASAYLPVNAAFRALAPDEAWARLVNPAWSALAIAAVWGVARRLWPERPSVALLAAVLLATSTQVLLTAMTSYAMPAHLALNLAWLWLFLRGGKLGNGGAVLVSLLACGLHQLVFHPLFAGPFILQLWLDRRWRLASFYSLALGAIVVFWLLYWSFLMRWLGAGPPPPGPADAGGVLARLIGLVSPLGPLDVSIMALNLIRLATWQNLLAAPLFVVGAAAAWRSGGALRALVAGLALTVFVSFLLMPYQGYGWGYRYVHGLLGSVALVAAWQWSRWTEACPERARSAALGAFAVSAAASILILLPARLAQASAWSAPYERASAAIAGAHADVVLLDETGIWFGEHLVRNDPFLRNRPLVLDAEKLTPAQVRALCARYAVAVFDRASAARLGVRTIAQAPRGLSLAACGPRPRL
ncbi:MAG TPA: hypothetical protein VGS12_08745 [Caulobacteraceae bacterium]|nr:hypothetical protein [Caulobacteraceae bacterium]